VKLLESLTDKREIPAPRWAINRMETQLRAIAGGVERERVVDRVCARFPRLESDIRRAVERAERSPHASRQVINTSLAPRSREYKGRSLARVPDGTRVWFQDMPAEIARGGMIVDDGVKPFDSPTAAAEYVNGGTEVNGWQVWKVWDGRSLSECYDTGSWPE
jgi:hypothetical protein